MSFDWCFVIHLAQFKLLASMRKIIFLFLILIISLKSSTGQPTFQKYFDLVGISEVQQTFDGGYIFAGNYFGIPFSYYNTALVKTDAFGDTSWVLTYSFTHRDFLKYVSQTEDSGFVVIGSSEDTINGWWQLIMTFKIDKFGNLNMNGDVSMKIEYHYKDF